MLGMLGTRIILCMLVLVVTAANLDHDFLHESSFAADYTVANAIQNFEAQTDTGMPEIETPNATDFLDYSDALESTAEMSEIEAPDSTDFLDNSDALESTAEMSEIEAPDSTDFLDYSDAFESTVGEDDFLDMVGLNTIPTDAGIRAEIALISTAIFRENPVLLGRAGDFAILSQSGISSIPHSLVVGNIGVSLIGATGITGFSLTVHPSNGFSSSTQVV
jgi:methionine-rich copper-binding protein CopC